MACMQLTGFGKGQIVAYNNCRLSLWDIAKKLIQHHSSINVFHKNHKKTGNNHQKEGRGHKRKTTASEDTKFVRTGK